MASREGKKKKAGLFYKTTRLIIKELNPLSITGTTGMSQTSASWLDDSKNLKNHEVNTRAKNKTKKAERKGEKKYAGTSNPLNPNLFVNGPLHLH